MTQMGVSSYAEIGFTPDAHKQMRLLNLDPREIHRIVQSPHRSRQTDDDEIVAIMEEYGRRVTVTHERRVVREPVLGGRARPSLLATVVKSIEVKDAPDITPHPSVLKWGL